MSTVRSTVRTARRSQARAQTGPYMAGARRCQAWRDKGRPQGGVGGRYALRPRDPPGCPGSALAAAAPPARQAHQARQARQAEAPQSWRTPADTVAGSFMQAHAKLAQASLSDLRRVRAHALRQGMQSTAHGRAGRSDAPGGRSPGGRSGPRVRDVVTLRHRLGLTLFFCAPRARCAPSECTRTRTQRRNNESARTATAV